MPTDTTAYALFIVLIATLIRSAFGFGEALGAVPLLAFLIPLRLAAPLAVLISITVAAIVVVQDWKKIHVHSATWLIFSSLVGIPFGLLLLMSSHQRAVKGALAVIIILFAAYSLFARTKLELRTDNRAWLFAAGFCAGVLGGAYGMNGPPLAMYGSLRRWPPASFRATLQGYFLPASLAGMTGYWLAGLWTPLVNRFYLLSLPGVLVGIFLGRWINRRLNARHFLLYVHAGLIAIGLVLLAQAL